MRKQRIGRATPFAFLVAAGLAAVAPAAAQPTLKDVIRQDTGEAPAAADATGEAGAAAAPSGDRAARDPAGRDTPRGAVRGYLDAVREGDYERAADYLLVDPRTETDPATLARQLEVVFDQKLWFDLSTLSDEPEGRTGDGLAASQEKVGEVPSARGPVPVILRRVSGEAGGRIWKFSSGLVGRVPALYEEHGYGPLGHYLPDFFFEIRLLEVQLWQWIGLMALAVAASLVSWVLASLIASVLARLLHRASSEIGERVVRVASGPLRLALTVFVFSGGKYLLNLAIAVNSVLASIENAFLIVAFTWVLLRAVDVASSMVEARLREQQQGTAVTLLPPGRKAVKLFVVVIAVLAAFDSFGFDVTAVLAGLGIGGIAIALAAQKSVENLFGGATLYADRPVRVGDFCRFGDKIGTVEEIGIRSTRVRTLDRTVVAVPNAEFANLQLENYTRRDRIWYHPTIGLRYETTPDQLRWVLVEIRKMLYAHPKVNPDPARIRFTGFGAYSLNLEIFSYVDVTDYGEFLEVAEDLNLRIMDIVEAAGSGFAFPSQTTYLEKGEGLDPERAGKAQEAVARWREERALYLPRFPQERIEELSGSLDFPPEGSPDARGGAR